MPFFGKKFKPKKTSLRKNFIHQNTSDSPIKLVERDGSTKLVLSDYSLLFQNGKWILELDDEEAKQYERKKMNSKLQHLEEENNLLKVKLEVLMNMLTETTLENNMQQKEIQELKKANIGK